MQIYTFYLPFPVFFLSDFYKSWCKELLIVFSGMTAPEILKITNLDLPVF